ncbi:putative monocarboxylate transporter mch1 [Geranomyces michiganensis]|nr:putative monocarboxylate transporter mch1 [Geranomyces michiganensis]
MHNGSESPQHAAAASSCARRRPSTRTLLLAVSLVCAAILQTAAGTVYLFGLYGPQLSERMDWSQKQTALVAGCLSWGISLSGPLLGTFVDKRATAPWPIFLVGGAAIATGYGLISATYSGALPVRHFAVVALYFLLVGAGSAACYHCSLATNIRNWPAAHRGVAVGVPVSMFGLSAYIYAHVADRFFYTRSATTSDRQLDIPRFLLLIAAVAVLAALLAAMVLRDYRKDVPEIMRAVVEEERGCGADQDENGNGVGIVEEEEQVEGEGEAKDQGEGEGEGEEEEEQRPLLQHLGHRRVRFDDDGESRNPGSESIIARTTVSQGDNAAVVSLWKQAEMYLLTASFCTLVGVGLMYSAGIGTLVVGLSPADATPASPLVQRAQNRHVTLFSICSFSGRMLTGLISDRAARATARSIIIRIPRIAWTSLASILMAIASGLMVVALNNNDDNNNNNSVPALLSVVTVLIGAAYGIVWTSTPTVLVDLVGGDVFATCWGWITLSAAFAAQALMVVFGYVYDAGAAASSSSSPSTRLGVELENEAGKGGTGVTGSGAGMR